MTTDSEVVVQMIREAMKPFDPVIVSFEVSGGLTAGMDIHIWVKTLPAAHFRYVLNQQELLSIQNPAFNLIGQKAGEYFSTFRVEPDANIILSDN